MLASSRRPWPSFAESGTWLILTIGALIYTFQFDDPLPVYEWGPAHWPRMVLIGMLLFAGWLFFSIWRTSSTPSAEQIKASVSDDLSALDRSAQFRVVLLFTLPVLYTYLIHKMGFLLVTPFFLFSYMWLMGVKRLRTLLIMTVCIYTALVLVFVVVIFTYLPPGAGIFNTINGHIIGLLT